MVMRLYAMMFHGGGDESVPSRMHTWVVFAGGDWRAFRKKAG